MRVRATASSLLIATLLCLYAAIPVAAQQQKRQPEWTWTDRDGKKHSRADLDEILKQHKLWWESKMTCGERADLDGADLRGANLVSTNLGGAHMTSADLRGANLFGALLTGSDLIRAD